MIQVGKMKRKPIASYCICNTVSLNVYGISYGIEDEMLIGFNDDKPCWYMIEYGIMGSPFVNINGAKYPLNEFMKI